MTTAPGKANRQARWRLVRSAPMPRAPLRDDAAQRRVIAHRSGPLLVRGAAGTGKTSTLIEAVAARVAGGTDPQHILALTFGRRGAQRLRQQLTMRIAAEPGPATGRELLVRTFPAYAFGLLRRAAAQAGEPPPRLLSGPEQDLVIRELLPGEAGWPEALEPALGTRAFAEQLRDLLLRAAERGIGPDDPLWSARPDWIAAARFLREYQETLALRDATTRGSTGYDHAELVQAAVDLLDEDPQLLAAERERLAAVYVDELADTDPAQIELLKRVAGGGKTLIAFGDPASSTYGFRGADPEIVRRFDEHFPGAAQIVLRTRHRGEPRREVLTLRSRVSEAAYLAQELRRAHLVERIPWSQMAVITRSMNDGYLRALRQAGVPAVVLAEDLPLHQQPAVKPFLLLLRCALRPAELTEETAVALLHSPLGGADPLTERKLRQGLRALAFAAGDEQTSSGDLLVAALREPAELVSLERRWAEPAARIGKLLQIARQTSGSAEGVLWEVWRASGLAERWAALATRPAAGMDQQQRAEAADRDLDAMLVLFDAAARFTDRLPGARIDTFLDHVLGQQLPADSLAATGDRGEAVRLLTAHAAKGLEWQVVAIPGVQEGVWPDLRLRGSLLGSEQLVDEVAQRIAGPDQVQRVAQTAALLAEERRLFQVAITRAGKRVLVTAVDSSAVGGVDTDERPSRFLYQLAGEGLPEDADSELELARPKRAVTLAGLVAQLRVAALGGDDDAARELARLAAEGVPGAHPDHWWGIAELTDATPINDELVRVTPSTIESALRCSLRWLLERHGGAEPPSSAQGVGNLVHAAAMLADKAEVDPAVLLDYVNARFDAIDLAARWLAGREQERAEGMVHKLTRWLAQNPRRLLAIEREFSVRLAGEPPIELTGRVDRLEVDEHGRLVVVDLKTGKTTTATQAELPEHPQLGAYQVAVAEGGFPEGDQPGGATLVQLGTPHVEANEQAQSPLRESDDPQWAHAMVRRTADTMAAATFAAKVNDKCRVCPVKTSCPVSGKGRQVVEP